MSVTQFVWNEALQMGDFVPPEPKGKKPRFGEDAECWLCGGPTEGKGWHAKDVIGSAFTDSNAAAAPASSTVCQACSALMKKEAWIPACEKFGFDPHFPVKDGKAPFLANWMFSSHVFAPGLWLRPDRVAARAVLLDPPSPPFVVTLAATGKKHVIFRAKVNLDRELFFVQLDDATLCVSRDAILQVMDDFEEGYASGFSKDSLLTGQYNQAAVMAAGLARWRQIEEKMSAWRKTRPAEMTLCHFCAQKPAE